MQITPHYSDSYELVKTDRRNGEQPLDMLYATRGRIQGGQKGSYDYSKITCAQQHIVFVRITVKDAIPNSQQTHCCSITKDDRLIFFKDIILTTIICTLWGKLKVFFFKSVQVRRHRSHYTLRMKFLLQHISERRNLNGEVYINTTKFLLYSHVKGLM